MQLKHLFVFLLVFLVSVADATVYSQRNSSEYYQPSKVIQKRGFNAKKTKRLILKKPLSFKNFLTFFSFDFISIKTYQRQVFLTLKLQKQLYQKIALENIQHTFLTTKITSSNSVSSLYIA
jgi:hypothetical protein